MPNTALRLASAPKRILIADDSATIRTLVSTFLETQGLTVCGQAVDGLDAIAKAKELAPDLILLDLAMPNLNGMEAASVLKRALPNVKIVLFTLFNEHVTDKLVSAVGVDVVLSKPDGIGQLMQCIQNLFGPPLPPDDLARSDSSVKGQTAA